MKAQADLGGPVLDPKKSHFKLESLYFLPAFMQLEGFLYKQSAFPGELSGSSLYAPVPSKMPSPCILALKIFQ